MGMCPKCSKISGAILLLVGIGFVARDWGYWGFWGLQWYSVFLFVVGLIGLAKSMCADCNAMCACAVSPAAKPKKK